MKKILESLFSIKNEGNSKVLTILGMKVKKHSKKNALFNKVNAIYQHLIDQKEQNLYHLDPCIRDGFEIIEILKKEDYDISKDYLNLIKDLDEESIITVNLILNRLKEYSKTGNYKFRLSKEEEYYYKEWNFIENNLVLEIKKDIFAYNNFLLPEKTFLSCVFQKKHGIELLKTLDSTKSIIDAGGYIGDSALVLSDYTEDKVYSFECGTSNYEKMLTTIELNNKTNIIPVKKALSDKSEKLKFYSNVSAPGSSGLDETKVFEFEKSEMEEVDAITLDSFVEENNIKVGLIKTDIEGAERAFLRGAENTIKTQKPALLLSIYHNYDDFFKIKTMLESWDLGYKFKIRRDMTESVLADTMLIAEVDRGE